MSDSNLRREGPERAPVQESEWFAAEIARYVARTDTPAIREATARGFRATPEEMGRAAVDQATAAARVDAPTTDRTSDGPPRP